MRAFEAARAGKHQQGVPNAIMCITHAPWRLCCRAWSGCPTGVVIALAAGERRLSTPDQVMTGCRTISISGLQACARVSQPLILLLALLHMHVKPWPCCKRGCSSANCISHGAAHSCLMRLINSTIQDGLQDGEPLQPYSNNSACATHLVDKKVYWGRVEAVLGAAKGCPAQRRKTFKQAKLL